MDHLITHNNKPELIYYFLTAYLLHFKGTLGHIQSIDELHSFTHKLNPVQMKLVLKNMKKLHRKYKDDDTVFVGALANNLPLPNGGGYPIFKWYPQDSVEFSIQVRKRVIEEE